MALTPGTKLGPYEIQSPLGAGGMGEVYRATDTKLGRDIALKVLPAEMAQDPERLGRFRREAKALAQLDHPNIVTIHTVEECGGVHFLTMQLVEGLPLDRLIPQGGLPVEKIVEIASALGDALAAAHEKGIVHRDLKPANVMVSNEGRVKVLDFGLAKDVRGSNLGDATMTSASRTEVGVVMGTPAYMSPEQTSGRPLDHRTDIFSLGVLLHEMATGRRPFEGSSSAELVSAILRDTPPSVTDVRPDLPSDLARIVRRCLEKDPRHRLQTARDVSNEFRDLARQTSQKSVPAKTSTARAVATADSGGARADEGFWVAVLPFKYAGDNRDLKALAEGLSEEVITGLSRFSYLRVIARGSTAKYSSESGDIRAIGKELGARYVMEGSIRQAGAKLRLAVQLVDATTGAHLWAETYERAFNSEAAFELQDDLVPRIVSTVADMHGVLPRSMSAAVRFKASDQLTPYEALLRGFGHSVSFSPNDIVDVQSSLERAVQQSSHNADCLAMLAIVQGDAYGFSDQFAADILEGAHQAAQAAVEAEPTNALAYHALAKVLFFERNVPAFLAAADRAVSLNPMDGATIAYMGILMAFAGDWERGYRLTEKGMQLNANHPGWHLMTAWHDAYRRKDYPKALELALKLDAPKNPWVQRSLTVSYAQLGRNAEASSSLHDLLALVPNYAQVAREMHSRWLEPALVEHMMDGLLKAGLEIDGEAPTSPSGATRMRTPSGESRADEGFWVAVLPFRGASGDAVLESLADGLTEDVTTGLSRFPYLQVIAHNSAMAYKSRAADIRTVGRELGARYVIEGSIRKRGRAIRVSAQLMDAVTGTQLWAEAYDREINDRESSDAGTFQVQDDLTDHIVTTVADGYGVLVRSMAAPTRDRKVEELSASELVLRHYAFMQQVDPQEHAVLRTGLEQALEREPNHATAWACLSNLYQLEYFDRFNPREKPLERAREAAWRAVKIDPACQMGWMELAAVHFFSRDFTAFRETAERAMSLNPRDGTTLAWMAIMIAFSGDWERGVALTQRAIDLNRHHPGWYHNVAFHHHYRKGEYEAALQAAKRINMPEFHWMHLATAASCGMLGRLEEARTATESLRKYNPTFLDLANVREDVGLWDPDKDEVERLLQGLQKAGLKYGTADSAATPDSIATKIETKLKNAPAAAGTASIAATTASGASRADEGFWVAVLPFKYAGASAELKALADGLSEEVTTGLSRFSYLRVIASGSTTKYSGESGDVRAIGKELGARYVMEGSLRQAGSKLRLAVQLVEATTGSHLWAETYERAVQPESVFELQDDLVPRIVATVADRHGVLAHSMSEAVRAKNSTHLTPYEAVLLSFGYAERLTSDEQAAAKACLEQSVAQAPGNADAWAMLAMVFCDEYSMGLKPHFSLMDQGLEAAKRAVKAGPSNHMAYNNLAYVHFLRREFGPCRHAAERALALNPMDGSNVWFVGLMLAYMGEWDRGCALAERAMELNPHYPGKYRYPPVFNLYRKGDYKGALSEALRLNMPDLFYTPLIVAAAAGQLGEEEIAEKAVRDLLALRPDMAVDVRENLGKWFQPEFVEHVVEGLVKAGLEIPPAQGSTVQLASPTTSGLIKKRASGATRTDEGFWVAVLPFKSTAASAELKALADGISEEIVAGLSRFSYLRVITSGSTQRYLDQSLDLRAVGKELGARYVVSGSLRQMGARLRVAAQLVDAATGAQLWSETYERPFSAETSFELQDDLSARIAATVGDAHGILAHSMSEALRDKPADQLTPYEAVLRSFGYGYRQTPEEHAAVRDALELAVEKAPGSADAWSMLARVYMDEFAHGTNLRPDALGRMLHAARQAVDAAPSSALAHGALGYAMFFRKEFQAFRTAAEQSIALNPLNSPTVAGMGALMAYAGDWEGGCALVERAMQLNPRHPGWYWIPLYCNAYRQGDYRGAVNFAIKFNLPGFHVMHEALAAAYGQLGEQEKAAESLREIFRLKPDYVTSVLERLEKWFDPEFVSHMLNGLRKAGLNIPEDRKQTLSGPVPAAPSIAVLPFANMSDDKEQDYFSDGLAEEILNLLAQIPGLKVIARTSAFAFRGKEQDIRGIAEALGVSMVLEGSVRRVGSRIRVTAQLINAADGSHLWSERYDRQLEDVFAVQDEIAAAIASELKLKFTPESAAHPRRQPNFKAYEAYLRYRHYQWGFTEDSLKRSRECLEQAIALDPGFALPYAGLADHCLASTVPGAPPKEMMPRARELALRALELDPDLPEAHGMLGVVAGNYELNWKEAEQRFSLATARAPIPWHVRQWFAYFYLLSIGRLEESRQQLRLTIEDDPLSQVNWMAYGAVADALGQFEEARKSYAKMLELDPRFWWGCWQFGMHHALYGNLLDARECAEKATDLFPTAPLVIGLRAGILQRDGEKSQADELLQGLPVGTAHAPFAKVCFHLVCGEFDLAVESALEAADEHVPTFIPSIIRPFETVFRKSASWPALLKKTNLAEARIHSQ